MSDSQVAKYRMAVLNSHPVQYFAPLYRRIAQDPEIDLTVYYCSRQGISSEIVDTGFGKGLVWDTDLLSGYRHKFLPNLGGDRGVRGFFSLVNVSIARELWLGRYDAILIHGHAHATNWIALAAAKASMTRVFTRGETHLLLKRTGFKRLARRPLMSAFYRCIDACLYIGTLNREFYAHHGVGDEKLFPVPYAVDNEFFVRQARAAMPLGARLKHSLRIPETVPVILYASKLAARKRPMDLLRAFIELRRKGLPAELVFVGEGPERQVLESEKRSRGLDGVHFVGFVNQTELPRYFAMANVFVLPSENEPWGLVVNEAMCAGLPIIATDEVGASRDLLQDGYTGCIYQAGDVAALTRCLLRVLGEPGLANAMGAHALDRVSQWNYQEGIRGIRMALAACCGAARK